MILSAGICFTVVLLSATTTFSNNVSLIFLYSEEECVEVPIQFRGGCG